jgi:hypothetical protein
LFVKGSEFRLWTTKIAKYCSIIICRRDQEQEEEEEDEEDDFLAWARIIGQGGTTDDHENTPTTTTATHHRRLGEPRNDDSDDVAANSTMGGGGQSREPRHAEPEHRRSTGGESLGVLPRMREAHLIRTYRPNSSRYLPHHMRRQRAGRGDDELEVEEEEAADQRLFLRAAPRVVRRSDNVRLFR